MDSSNNLDVCDGFDGEANGVIVLVVKKEVGSLEREYIFILWMM